MKFIYYMLFFILMSSCQNSQGLQDWFFNIEDYSLTQLASEQAGNATTKEDKARLLILFLDLEQTRSCSELKHLAENNDLLEDYEGLYNLPKGFLFDIFYEYNHINTVFLGRDLESDTTRLAIFIANIWKTKFTINRINSVIADLTNCYPY